MAGETLENIGANIVGRVVRQPLGVFCGVAPFNFPALVFGWMRQATGSILAGVLFHAASNLVSEVLHGFFF